jgi:hypothetical protein
MITMGMIMRCASVNEGATLIHPGLSVSVDETAWSQAGWRKKQDDWCTVGQNGQLVTDVGTEVG